MTDSRYQPSPFGTRLLERFAETLFPELVGDMLEQFEDIASSRSIREARRRFWLELIRYGILAVLHKLIRGPSRHGALLLPSFLKTGVRSMARNKGFTLISVFSLSLGLAVWLLLMLLVRDQQKYDEFHERADRIVRVTSRTYNRSIDLMVPLASSPGLAGPVLEQALPEVEKATRLARLNTEARVNNERIQLQAIGAEPSFFDLFDFTLAVGDVRRVLERPNSIVLSTSAATNLFGSADPVGQNVHLLSFGDFTVTGIVGSPAGKSHIQFEALVSLSSWEGASMVRTRTGSALRDWTDMNSFWTYLLLSEVAAAEAASAGDFQFSGLRSKVNAVLSGQYAPERQAEFDFAIEPLREIALFKGDLGNQIAPVLGSRPLFVISIFALIIMLIAAVNFVGLSISRSARRSREVGVRKVLGANGSQIIRQFLSEAMLIASGSLILGVSFLIWLIPVFNGLRFMQNAGVELSMSGLLDLQLLGYFVAVTLIVGLLAGIVPSVHLARFRPATVLSGSYRVGGGSRIGIRKMLIVGQFTMSILFVVVATVMYRQIDHLMSADYGFKSDRLVSVELNGTSYRALRDAVRGSSSIKTVAAASAIPVATGKSLTYIQSDSLVNPLFVYFYSTSETFAEALGLNVLTGRFFSPDRPSDREDAIVINEVTAFALGFESTADAVDQYVRIGLDPAKQSTYLIVGVLENFYFENDRDVIRRLVLFNDPAGWRYAIAAPATDSEEATLALASSWDRVNPDTEFVANTFKGLLNEALNPVKDLRYVLSIAAGLAIFLSCLGLIGFATFTAEKRRFEVGIRKIVGASSGSVVLLLARDYSLMMLVGVLFALPLIFVAYSGLMQNFPVRAGLSFLWTTVGILAVILMGFLSTVLQTWRTASINPITVVRNE